jgi:signal peptidase I
MNDQAREQSKCSLAVEVLKSWGELRLQAKGISMLPTLWPGDLVTVQSRSSGQVQAGDIVLYIREGRFFVHRMVSKFGRSSEPFVITRGDCTPEEDPPVAETELLGTVTQIRRRGSTLAPSRKLSPCRLVLARMLCHCNLFQQVVLRLHARRSGAASGVEFSIDRAGL